MRDIADGIFKLAIVQRPPAPIGKAGALVDLMAEISCHKVGIADLFAQPQRHGGNLGIEQRRRCLASQIIDDLEILTAGVEHL